MEELDSSSPVKDLIFGTGWNDDQKNIWVGEDLIFGTRWNDDDRKNIWVGE